MNELKSISIFKSYVTESYLENINYDIPMLYMVIREMFFFVFIFIVILK